MSRSRRESILSVPSARWPRPAWPIVVLAAIGGILLTVIAATSWPAFGDEQAYWSAAERLLRGEGLYDPASSPNTPYAYWYPPVMAQALAPFTLVLPPPAFTAIWTALLVACVWQLAGRNAVLALACVAFLPVALELRVRNVHLLIALLTVLALRRSWIFWIPAAALKLAPVLGVVYLLGAGRRREAALTLAAGAAIAAASVVLAPSAWADFSVVALQRATSDGGGLVPVPYALRLAAGTVLAFVAGRRGGRAGEVSLVVAITLASPTLWANAFGQLLAVLPLLRATGPGDDRRVIAG